MAAGGKGQWSSAVSAQWSLSVARHGGLGAVELRFGTVERNLLSQVPPSKEVRVQGTLL
jgi:hypothetical protein